MSAKVATVFNLGDEANWTSQAGGYTRKKVGKIIEIVPAGIEPRSKLKDPGMPRNHESYVVAVGKTNYWPRVGGLRVDQALLNKALPKRPAKRLTTCLTCHGSGMVMTDA